MKLSQTLRSVLPLSVPTRKSLFVLTSTGGCVATLLTGAAIILLAGMTPAQAEHPVPPTMSEPEQVLSLAVKNELLSNEAVDVADLDVKVSGGVVTLAGRVWHLQGKRQAARSAALVRGVTGIVNQMIVLPSDRDDQLLTLDVEHALQRHAATQSWKIIPVVENGQARLGGKVSSAAQKRLAEEVVAGVRGIREIDNRIEVVAGARPTDEQMLKEIRALLDVSARLQDAVIEVMCRDGIVTLNGRVASARERQVAEQLAEVNGVQSVDVRGLEIDPTIRDGVRRQQRYAELTDEEIEDSVLLVLQHNPLVLSFLDTIEVDSQDAVVTLRGTVQHLAAKEAAEQSADLTLGVHRVRNRLKVEWNDAADDRQIAEFVREALLHNAYVGHHDIIVRSRNAHVDLFGLVSTPFEKHVAERVANMQKDVVHVNNHLTVTDDWVPRSDEEIQEAIEQKLKWTFFDGASAIDVNVENGVAILRGTVHTRRQWQRVMDIAVEAGARKPHSLLRIHLKPQHGPRPLYVPASPGAPPITPSENAGDPAGQ